MSTGPSLTAAAWTWSAPASVLRSPMAMLAVPPSPRMDFATASVLASSRPCTTTAAPSAARTLAISSPRPLLDPVTRARLPPSCRSMVMSSFRRLRRTAGAGRRGRTHSRQHRKPDQLDHAVHYVAHTMDCQVQKLPLIMLYLDYVVHYLVW